MENCKEEMLNVTIYTASVTDYFSKYEMTEDDIGEPLMELDFPRSIVEEWYNENPESFKGENFEDWFFNESTADDTDGLYDFSVERGFKPDIPKPHKYEVQFTATYMVWAFDQDGAYDSAQRQFNKYSDYYAYVDGKAYL